MKFLPHENPHDLSGRAVVKALCKHWEYRQTHQEGVISSCRQIGHFLTHPGSRSQLGSSSFVRPDRVKVTSMPRDGLTPDFLDALPLELKTAAFSRMTNSGTPTTGLCGGTGAANREQFIGSKQTQQTAEAQ